ncbi:MAG: cytochrome c oxidase assembly protein [SAR116 cluster bacterium]|nr:cytochrome c oxidase assembly protein [SAR116 cluster bacterium]RPG93144.1 MAG: cytochrome c oxidase assembly protein [Candidatus Puniceispirillum sp. TMED213]
MHNQGKDQRDKTNNRLLFVVAVVVMSMVGLAYASVPLYKLFCQVTGFGGTTQIATQAPEQALLTVEPLAVRLDANVNPQLNWSFVPIEQEVSLKPGEEVTAIYRATNIGTMPSTGTATFNVTPQKAGPYFMKIECFCFTEQTLQPGESIDMPVRFFLDSEIVSDINTSDIDEIVLSYTFFKAMGNSS